MIDYTIREYKVGDYNMVCDVLNQLLYPLISPFVKIPKDKGSNYLKDFGIVKEHKNEGLYVVEIDNKIAGVMNLRSDVFNKGKHQFMFWKTAKEYGFFQTMKALVVLSALEVKVQPNEVYVDFIVVDESFRSRGIGSKLLTHGQNLSKKHKKEVYFLHVLDNNPKGRALYERFGFEFVKETKFPKYVAKRMKATKDQRLEIKL